jgi:hypothetical protein
MLYWETVDENWSDYELEFARIWQDTPKIVFSNSLEKVESNARLATGRVADEVARLKEQPGKDMGSAAPVSPPPASSWGSSTSFGPR